MPPSRTPGWYQKYHLKWPWSSRQVENLDEMLGEIFKGLTDLMDTGAASTAAPTRIAAGVTIDAGDGGSVITGIKGYRRITQDGVIKKVSILSSQSGDIVFDIFKDPFASYPPTTSIVGAAPPTLTADDHAEDVTLVGWTIGVTAGEVLGFSVTSVSGLERVTLQLDIEQ